MCESCASATNTHTRARTHIHTHTHTHARARAHAHSGHTGRVLSVVLLSAASLIVSAGADGTLRFWGATSPLILLCFSSLCLPLACPFYTPLLIPKPTPLLIPKLTRLLIFKHANICNRHTQDTSYSTRITEHRTQYTAHRTQSTQRTISTNIKHSSGTLRQLCKLFFLIFHFLFFHFISCFFCLPQI